MKIYNMVTCNLVTAVDKEMDGTNRTGGRPPSLWGTPPTPRALPDRGGATQNASYNLHLPHHDHSKKKPLYASGSLPTTGTMNFDSLKDTVSNLTLYDIKAGVRKVQNGEFSSAHEGIVGGCLMCHCSRDELYRDGGKGARGDQQ
jgi:hypothetical protein